MIEEYRELIADLSALFLDNFTGKDFLCNVCYLNLLIYTKGKIKKCKSKLIIFLH